MENARIDANPDSISVLLALGGTLVCCSEEFPGFSGGGAGTPAPGGADRSPTNTMRAMLHALSAAWAEPENEKECIGASHPLGGFVVDWYQAIFESMIEPKLLAAAKNDLLLAEAC